MAASLDREQVQKAVVALLNHDRQKHAKETNLLADDTSRGIHLIVAVKKIPQLKAPTVTPIELKHAPARPDAQVCLFTKDPQREYKDLIAKKNITNIHRVVGLAKLRGKHHTFEAKRILSSQYDVFLADDRILPMMAGILGKTFIDAKKLPFPVSVKSADTLKEQVDRILRSVAFFPFSGVSTSTVTSYTSQSAEHIVENIEHVAQEIINTIPKKWKNVKSIHIKTSDSIALPIFVTGVSDDDEKEEKEEVKQQDEKASASRKGEKVAVAKKGEKKDVEKKAVETKPAGKNVAEKSSTAKPAPLAALPEKKVAAKADKKQEKPEPAAKPAAGAKRSREDDVSEAQPAKRQAIKQTEEKKAEKPAKVAAVPSKPVAAPKPAATPKPAAAPKTAAPKPAAGKPASSKPAEPAAKLSASKRSREEDAPASKSAKKAKETAAGEVATVKAPAAAPKKKAASAAGR